MKLEEAIPGKRVRYVPNHVDVSDTKHPDNEYGKISSSNDHYIFVKFDKNVEVLGWDGATAQACQAHNLVYI